MAAFRAAGSADAILEALTTMQRHVEYEGLCVDRDTLVSVAMQQKEEIGHAWTKPVAEALDNVIRAIGAMNAPPSESNMIAAAVAAGIEDVKQADLRVLSEAER